MSKAAHICVAKIGAAHGVRGEVKIWPFTEDPLAVTRYGALTTKDGTRQFEVTRARVAKDHLVGAIKGITDRDQAARVNGVELYISRDQLPIADDGEYYHADLIGLVAMTENDTPLGRVVAVHNFGAGDILEVAPQRGPTQLYLFTDAIVPTVDIAGGRVVIVPPAEIEGDASSGESHS